MIGFEKLLVLVLLGGLIVRVAQCVHNEVALGIVDTNTAVDVSVLFLATVMWLVLAVIFIFH